MAHLPTSKIAALSILLAAFTGTSSFAHDLSHPFSQGITVRLNLNVSNPSKSCPYYERLGFENDKDCKARGVAILYNGNIQLTLWPKVDEVIEATNLPILIRNEDLYFNVQQLEALGGKNLPKSPLSSTFCFDMADPDGHQLKLCP